MSEPPPRRVSQVGEVARWERVRRFRYGCLIRLFRHRYGCQLPDDDAGREDLWLLLQNVSLASAGSEKKVRAAIEIWAPWLSEEEARERIEFLGVLTIYERSPTARELGERLGVTNAEREALKLCSLSPSIRPTKSLLSSAGLNHASGERRRGRSWGVRVVTFTSPSLKASSVPGKPSAFIAGLGNVAVPLVVAQ